MMRMVAGAAGAAGAAEFAGLLVLPNRLAAAAAAAAAAAGGGFLGSLRWFQQLSQLLCVASCSWQYCWWEGLSDAATTVSSALARSSGVRAPSRQEKTASSSQWGLKMVDTTRHLILTGPQKVQSF